MIMNKYAEKFKKELFYSNRYYNKIKAKTDNGKHKKIVKLLYCLLNYPTGIYSSYFIESYYLKLSEKIKIPLSNKYEKKSVLHVMSTAYEHGGHTRVVERWIGFSDKTEKHSIFFTTSDTVKIPELLKKEVCDRKGEIIELSNDLSLTDKALRLREYASNYDKIILHIHNYDAVPLVAFGTKDFKRPVIFSNHSDHLFWLGVSISDICVNFREYGNEININKRHIDRNYIIGLPFISDKNISGKRITRDDLNISSGDKIVLTYATGYKYKPISDLNIANVIKDVLNRNHSVVFIIIGINEKIEELDDMVNNYNGRVIIKDLMPHSDLIEYIRLSDIIIDSFPVAGGTSLIDGLYQNKPVLSVYSLIGQQDYIMNSDYYCSSIKEFTNTLLNLISSEELCRENINLLRKNAKNYNTKEAFCKGINKLYNLLPEKHSVYKFADEDIVDDFIDCDVLQIFTSKHIRRVLGYKKLFEINKVRQFDSKKYEVSIFGRKIFSIKIKQERWMELFRKNIV